MRFRRQISDASPRSAVRLQVGDHLRPDLVLPVFPAEQQGVPVDRPREAGKARQVSLFVIDRARRGRHRSTCITALSSCGPIVLMRWPMFSVTGCIMVGSACRGWLRGIVLIGALCVSGPAWADLALFMILVPYEKGDAEQQHNASLSLYSMITGLFGGNAVAFSQTGKRIFCLDDPEVMGARAYFTILSDYAKAHPGADDLNAGLVLARAMAERYPCPR